VIDAVSISLNAENKEKYNSICKPLNPNVYESIIEFIKDCRERLETGVTVIDIPEIDIEKCRKIARDLRVGFRVRKLIKK
jgi:TatD family-associated radical SAM protein